MAYSDSHPGHFVVSAKSGEGYVQQTRKVAASAIVLALSWLESGHTEVTVIDPTGKPLSPESYRNAAMQRIDHGHRPRW